MLLFLFLACATTHPRGDWVRHVHYEGNEVPGLKNDNNDVVLTDAMEQPHGQRPSFLRPRVEPSRLNRDLLREDALRVETLYAHHGYFDAEVDGYMVVRRPHWGRLKPVDIVGFVRPHEPSKVTEVRVDGLPPGPLAQTLRSRIDLAPGDVFMLDSYTTGIAQIRADLQERSYAYAKVEGNVEVDPKEHSVYIAVTIDRGPACHFGPVKYVGFRKVKRDRITFKVKEGEPYHISDIEATRRELFGLRVFQLVNVTPDLSDPTSPEVPVTVQVRESKSHSVKLGLLASAQDGSASLGADVVYEDWNLGGRLWTFQQEGRASAHYTDSLGPQTLANGVLTLKRFPISGFDLSQSGRFEQDVAYGVLSLSLTSTTALNWVRWDRHVLSVGYRLKYTLLPLPHLLSIFEQSWTYEGRNDPLSPSRGWYWTLQTAEAGGPLQGDYDFFRVQGDIRTYRSIVRLFGWDPDVIVAGRLAGGIEVPYAKGADKTAVLRDERFFLGGDEGVRGWGYRRLGPRAPDALSRTMAPEGGLARVFGSFELRKALIWGLSAAAFVDTGGLWDTIYDLNLPAIQWTVGGGLRYQSIAGPLRFDVAMRLGQDPYYANNPPFSYSIGLGEAF